MHDRFGRPTLIATLRLCNFDNINPKNHVDAAFYAIEMMNLKLSNLIVDYDTDQSDHSGSYSSNIPQANVIV